MYQCCKSKKIHFKTYWHNRESQLKNDSDMQWPPADYKMLKMLDQLEREGGIWENPYEMSQILILETLKTL